MPCCLDAYLSTCSHADCGTRAYAHMPTAAPEHMLNPVTAELSNQATRVDLSSSRLSEIFRNYSNLQRPISCISGESTIFCLTRKIENIYEYLISFGEAPEATDGSSKRRSKIIFDRTCSISNSICSSLDWNRAIFRLDLHDYSTGPARFS